MYNRSRYATGLSFGHLLFKFMWTDTQSPGNGFGYGTSMKEPNSHTNFRIVIYYGMTLVIWFATPRNAWIGVHLLLDLDSRLIYVKMLQKWHRILMSKRNGKANFQNIT